MFLALFVLEHFGRFFVSFILNLQWCETKAGHRFPHWIHSSNLKSRAPAIQLNALGAI
jgi:hypothetical protein